MKTELTPEQVRHIRARVAIASAVTVLEETFREHLGPAALYQRTAKGKLDKKDERYLVNCCTNAINHAKKATSFVERRLFAEGVYEVAYDELYSCYEIHIASQKLNPEQRSELLRISREMYDNSDTQTISDQNNNQ